MNKPVVKKKGSDGFAEVSFSETAQAQEEKGGETPSLEQGKEDKIVGVNPLTQKPIIKSIERKPMIRGVIDQKPDADGAKDEEELIAHDVTVSELRKKQLQDITPVSNEPAKEGRELSPADLARRIWEEKEKKKAWHTKLMGRFGFK